MVNFKEGQFGVCAEPQQLVSGAHQVSLRAEVGTAQGSGHKVHYEIYFLLDILGTFLL